MPFTALPGYFQAFENKDSKGIDSTVTDQLALVNHRSWKELYDSIPQDTDTYHYKLVVLARHGQGYHNAAVLRYGQEAWDSYWSLLDGDEYGEWLDAKLTPLGKKQVQDTGDKVLLPIVQELNMLPHVFFSSPMRRCLETFIGSWNTVFTENRHHVTGDTIPIRIIENIRESLGEHTCDERVPHSVSLEEYQDHKTNSGHVIHWNYEPHYPEKDQLWFADKRETEDEMDHRLHKGLSQLFKQLNSEEKFISVTCHSGVIQSVLRNLKHPPVKNLDTGKIVCAVVKVNKTKLDQLANL